MPSWKDLPQLMASRVVEADCGIASALFRFDNGIFLWIEPLIGSPDLLLRFELLQAADGTPLSPPLAEAARPLQGGLAYRVTKAVTLPSGDRGATPEGVDGLNGLRLALAATSGRLYVATAKRPEKLPPRAPRWNARAEFMVVGEQRGWTEPLDFSETAPRILAAIDAVHAFLSESIESSRRSR